MGKKLWVSLTNALGSTINELVCKCSFPKPIAQFLAARGISPEKVDMYMNPALSNLSDPFRFPGIEIAVARLWKAIQNREPILIHGDYDTDGVTATAMLAWVLRKNGAEVRSFLPHRFDDGYGFTPESLKKALEGVDPSCKLLVTVDCGINSVEAVREATSRGIDVIITDHHEPGPEIPGAMAIVNPKLYPELADLHLLSGVGAAFKLSHAFIKYGRDQNFGGFTTDLQEILDLVALGTIADIVPLLGENRILVRHGMSILTKQLRPGVRALIETAKVKSKLKPSDITFKLAPRINAAGRLGNANTALALLDATNIVEAYRYAEELENFNTRRQEKEQEIYNEARLKIEQTIDVKNSYSILVAGEDWHQGVIGIVASRLARDYNRPGIVLTIQGNEAHGSGRSIGNLNLVKVLSECGGLLTRFGGHPMAVGLGMEKDKIEQFYAEFERTVRKHMSAQDLVDHLDYDGETELTDLNDNFFQILDGLGPFGHGNPQPVFRINRLETVKTVPVGEMHTRGILRDRRGDCMDFIAFNRSADSLPRTEWDVIATPQINEYYGERKYQVQLLDLQPSYGT